MSNFQFLNTDIEGLFLVNSFCIEDNRGLFVKSFEKDVFGSNGIPFSTNELFFSRSSKYVIRGLHFQTNNPQIKLVGVINGRVFDVVVDLRKESPTFGKWQGFYLTDSNLNSLAIPRGCAHGFMSLSDDSIMSYNCDGLYDKESDTGIRFDDPEIGIEWPINDIGNAIISTKDRNLMSFSDYKNKYCIMGNKNGNR